jgi:sugar transferase (PEP-CTERM/EpsH1 system associated)
VLVKPPLILHVIYRLDFGGLENGLVNLINNLPQDLAQHAILTLAGYSRFAERIRRPGVELLNLDKRPGKDPAIYARCWRALRRLRPSIVHTRNLGTVDLQWVACAAGVPIRVHGEHGWDADDARGTSPRHLWIRRWCRPAIHRHIAVSEDLASWLRTSIHVRPERIETIINGVDTRRFQPAGDQPADLPWYDGALSKRPLIFGTVGRLDPVKNHAGLLRAFAALVVSRPGIAANLVIVGDGPELDRLRRLVCELRLADMVWLAGARDDIPALLRAFDVFVLPSINEGISNTLLEAMASGRPVIAARVGGNAELVTSGSDGQLYDSARETELVAAMQTYLDDSAQRLRHGRAARLKVETRFSLSSMVDGYSRMYGALLRQRLFRE